MAGAAASYETRHYATQPTKRELRDLAGGNVIVADILNRIQYDFETGSAAFGKIRKELTVDQQQSRFTVLMDNPRKKKLCWYWTWGKPCLYGGHCKYDHSKLRLEIMSHAAVLPKSGGSMTALERHPIEDYLNADVADLSSISFVEYDKKIVWARDGGESSAALWNHFAALFTSRRERRLKRSLMGASNGCLPSPSSRSHPSSANAPTSQIVTNLERAMADMCPDTWVAIMAFLTPVEALHTAVALASSKYTGVETCNGAVNASTGGLLDPRVLESMVEKFWPSAAQLQRNHQQGAAISSLPPELLRFRDLTNATVYAYAVTIGAFAEYHKAFRKFSADSSSAEAAEEPSRHERSSEGLVALDAATGQSRPTKTMCINLGKSASFESPSSEGIGCIRHSRSIVACTVGNSEIFVFQLDGGKRAASTSKPCKRQCELLDIPPMNSSSAQDLLIHAGDGVLYWRDLHDPNLGILGRVPLGRAEHREGSWLAGLSMDIPNRQVTVGRSPDLPMGYSPCVGSIDIFDLETRELVTSWDLPWETGGLVALDRVDNPAYVVASTENSVVSAWDARIGGRGITVGELLAPPMPRAIAQRGHLVAVGTASAGAVLFDVRKPGRALVSGVGGPGLPCSHVAFSASTFTAWTSTSEANLASVYDLSPALVPIVELAELQQEVTAVSQPARRSAAEEFPSMPAPSGSPVLCVLGVRRPKHSGKGGMKHDLCIVTDVSDESVADGKREINVDALCPDKPHSPRHHSMHGDGYTPGRVRGGRRSGAHTAHYRQTR